PTSLSPGHNYRGRNEDVRSHQQPLPDSVNTLETHEMSPMSPSPLLLSHGFKKKAARLFPMYSSSFTATPEVQAEGNFPSAANMAHVPARQFSSGPWHGPSMAQISRAGTPI